MQLPTPRAVIFDWDNTLVDTWPVIHEALRRTFIELGQDPWTIEQTRMRVRHSMRDSFPILFGKDWGHAATRYQAHYRSMHLEQLTPLPGSEDVLQRVKALGLVNVVVSNKKGVNLRKEVEHLGWRDYFDAVVGADDAAKDKPFADPVHLALEETGITPGPDVWFIGDSEVDLECAKVTGCTPILYGEFAREHAEYTDSHFVGFEYKRHAIGHDELLEMLRAVPSPLPPSLN